ncbi:hypothetical protein [Nocardia puris]|uniref:Uncharacterized protein n=1 Tax=Nocardia puris TaxID=208602 RepID=A0A366CXX5_9NOCA|nr:hypothetical protein [Nocardia puris]RBO82465.1 hypothetical protein DFR74_1225 [Nocardia puris]
MSRPAHATIARQDAPSAAGILLQAKGFHDHGGWLLDSQFDVEMPCLLAHGLGVPVADARATIEIPRSGAHHLWVRTKA